MTKSKAADQARQDITMYRQGRGWIVSQWDERARVVALDAVRAGASSRHGGLVAAGQIVYYAACGCPRAHDGLCDTRRIMRRVEGPDGQDHGTRRLPDLSAPWSAQAPRRM